MTGADHRWLVAALFLSACGSHEGPQATVETQASLVATCAIEHAHLLDERTLHGVVDTPPDRRA